jgi:hypothetical protein
MAEEGWGLGIILPYEFAQITCHGREVIEMAFRLRRNTQWSGETSDSMRRKVIVGKIHRWIKMPTALQASLLPKPG